MMLQKIKAWLRVHRPVDHAGLYRRRVADLERALGDVLKSAGLLIEAAAKNAHENDHNDTYSHLIYRAREHVENGRLVLRGQATYMPSAERSKS